MRTAARLCYALSLGVAAFIAWPAPAGASETYPAEMQEALDMPCAPPCTICHATIAGGKGTITRDFGGLMVSRGLRENDDACIAKALMALDLGHVGNACDNEAEDMGMPPPDSDGDGTADVAELRDGSDPNRAGADASVCVLKYGCGARIVPDGRPIAGLGLLLLGSVALARRWRSRASGAAGARAAR